MRKTSANTLTTLLLITALTAMTGCGTKKASTPPYQAQTPLETEPETPPPATAEVKPTTPPPAPAPAPEPAPVTTAPEQPVHHRRVKPSPSTPEAAASSSTGTGTAAPTGAATPAATASPAPAAAPPAPVATNVEPAATTSAIGELSAGDATSAAHTRGETATLIATTDKQLREIGRPLSAQEQKTAAQVRKFLQQSREALHSQDVDAAHTLATKAKLLLDELVK